MFGQTDDSQLRTVIVTVLYMHKALSYAECITLESYGQWSMQLHTLL